MIHLDSGCDTPIDALSYKTTRTSLHCKILSSLRIAPRARIINPTAKCAEQSVLYPRATVSCIFCGAAKENGFNIVWENDTYTVFTDINPAAEQHMQVIPKRHIESVKALFPSDAAMVREMMIIGHRILDSLNIPVHLRRLGFHIPPYISVPHLHMHVQALPYRSCLRRLKYPVLSGRNHHEKGFSWFADAEQTARILEKGAQVRILPC